MTLVPLVHGAVVRPAKRSFNFNLESLRGLSALVVVWHHVIVHPHQLDPNYVPTGVASYNAPGHFAVLIFFLLSGFVIGRRYAEPLQRNEVVQYLRKRFERLYPMYVLAVLAGIIASGFTVSLSTISQHLLFLQGWGGPVMFENNPLWSLQYEVLFYLAFIPLSLLRAKPWIVATTSTLVGLVLLLLGQGGVAQYFFGFSFWALGWTLSVLTEGQKPLQWTQVLSALFLLLCIEYLNPLVTVAHKIGAWVESRHLADTSMWPSYILNIYDYAALPYASSIVLCVSGVSGRLVRWMSWLLQLLPMVGIVYAVRHWHESNMQVFLLPSLFYLISCLLFVSPTHSVTIACRKVIEKLIPLGKISYGLYVIHFPVLSLFQHIETQSTGYLMFTFRAVLYVSLSLSAAYTLDRIFQPWIASNLFKKS